MAVAIEVYDQLTELLARADLDMDDGVGWYVALVDSGYTFSAAHTQWADASANEIVGAGYVAGGKAVANLALSQSSGITVFDGDDTVWTGLTATFRRGIVYKSGTHGGLTNPLAWAILFDSTPGDLSLISSDFTIAWHATDGLVKLTKSPATP